MCLLSMLLSACVTPIVIENDGIRVGLYQVTTTQPQKHVECREIRGGGLTLRLSQFHVGYVHCESIQFDGVPDAYVETEYLSVATGSYADVLAQHLAPHAETDRSP